MTPKMEIYLPECKNCRELVDYADFDYSTQYCNDCSAEFHHFIMESMKDDRD